MSGTPTILALRTRINTGQLPGPPGESAGLVPELLDFGLTLTKRLASGGVGLLLGSDDMNPYLVPGISLHEELALFVRAGLSPFQALRADLLLLEGNPLEDVANASRRVGVMARGRWFAEAELQRHLRAAGDAFGKAR